MKIPGLRQLILLSYRLVLGLKEIYSHSVKVLRWWVRSKETTNYTYDLSSVSDMYLAHFVAHHTGKSVEEIRGYMNELKGDQVLRGHIRAGIFQSGMSYKADTEIYYGKRLGWYAFVRATKPKVVVETGLDKGLGAVVLCSALMRNAAEGHNGYYYGTDINPKAGYLLKSDYARFGEVLYGDSIASLEKLEARVDLFINDSDHSAQYEAQEYLVIAPKLSAASFLIGDNCEVTDALCVFAEKTGRIFGFWREEPLQHWFSGGGMGVAYFETKSSNSNHVSSAT